MADQQITATVRSMTRLTNSKNGGPRYRLEVGDPSDGLPFFACVTADDTMDSFAWNPAELTGKSVVLTLNDRHRVIGIDPIEATN